VRLRMAIARLHRRLRPTRAGSGLTASEAAVLAAVVRAGRASLAWLAEEEGLNPSMLSRVVRRLEEEGLVVRMVEPLDRRSAYVVPTPEGLRLQELIKAERAQILAGLLSQMRPSERRRLEAALPLLEELAEALRGRTP
jgi:DNA-binding MarR family transcriptional regulator